MQLLEYGLKDDILVHIDTVANGLNCECICPSCGGKLVAHQGQKKHHHFKHYKVTDCNHGQESALHLMAKRIISETHTVYIPNAPINIYDLRPKGKCYKFEEVYIEKEITPQLRCDVLLKSKDTLLNVEIKVTHEIDNEKKYRIFNENLRTIEIDLSDIIDDFNENVVRTIIESGNRTSLIYSPKSKDVYAKWLLGDWKKIYRDRYQSEYVKDCHGEIAYLTGIQTYHEHKSCQCHECWGYNEYDGGDMLLCRSMYGNLEFKKIKKILDVQRDKGNVVFAKISAGGQIKTFGNKKQQ